MKVSEKLKKVLFVLFWVDALALFSSVIIGFLTGNPLAIKIASSLAVADMILALIALIAFLILLTWELNFGDETKA